MTDAAVFLARDPPLGFLTLNRPDKLNALNEAMWAAIPPLVAEVARDPALRVLIVHGGRAEAFAAGADIAELGQIAPSPERRRRFADAVYAAQGALAALAKPTIAMVRGPCVGGGCGLALACDLRVAARDARFGITPAKLGLSYRLEETKRLVDLVGPARAKDILFSARLLDADEAFAIGLANRVWPTCDLDSETRRLALTLAANSRYSLAAIKEVIGLIGDGAARDSDRSTALFLDAFAGEDFAEGQAAFMAKRPPQFPKG